jgi:hypothetical protein
MSPRLRPTVMNGPLGSDIAQAAYNLAAGADKAVTLHFEGRGSALYLRDVIEALAQPGLVILEDLSASDLARVSRFVAALDADGKGEQQLLGPDGYGQVTVPVAVHPDAELVYVHHTLELTDLGAPATPAPTDLPSSSNLEL